MDTKTKSTLSMFMEWGAVVCQPRSDELSRGMQGKWWCFWGGKQSARCASFYSIVVRGFSRGTLQSTLHNVEMLLPSSEIPQHRHTHTHTFEVVHVTFQIVCHCNIPVPNHIYIYDVSFISSNHRRNYAHTRGNDLMAWFYFQLYIGSQSSLTCVM